MTNLTTNPSQGERTAHLPVKNFLFKQKICRLLLTSVIILFSVYVNATNYYVSSSGNDANSGTSESSPWKTLNKVNSFTPKPGDQILFKRGEEWTGSYYSDGFRNIR